MALGSFHSFWAQTYGSVLCSCYFFGKCYITDASRHRKDQRLGRRGKPNCFLQLVLHSHRHHHHCPFFYLVTCDSHYNLEQARCSFKSYKSFHVLLYISPTQLGFLSQEHTKALRKEIQHCFSSYFRTINATIS